MKGFQVVAALLVLAVSSLATGLDDAPPSPAAGQPSEPPVPEFVLPSDDPASPTYAQPCPTGTTDHGLYCRHRGVNADEQFYRLCRALRWSHSRWVAVGAAIRATGTCPTNFKCRAVDSAPNPYFKWTPNADWPKPTVQCLPPHGEDARALDKRRRKPRGGRYGPGYVCIRQKRVRRARTVGAQVEVQVVTPALRPSAESAPVFDRPAQTEPVLNPPAGPAPVLSPPAETTTPSAPSFEAERWRGLVLESSVVHAEAVAAGAVSISMDAITRWREVFDPTAAYHRPARQSDDRPSSSRTAIDRNRLESETDPCYAIDAFFDFLTTSETRKEHRPPHA